jgi:hypothetical protein
MAIGASIAVAHSRVLSPRINDPLKVSAVRRVAWDAVLRKNAQATAVTVRMEFTMNPRPYAGVIDTLPLRN